MYVGTRRAPTVKYCRRTSTHQPMPRAKAILQVDANALGLHDYHQVIRRPMDLGTIKKSLTADTGAYSSSAEVLKDVQQVWANCRTYNDEDDPIMYVHSLHSSMLCSATHQRVCMVFAENLAFTSGNWLCNPEI